MKQITLKILPRKRESMRNKSEKVRKNRQTKLTSISLQSIEGKTKIT